MEAIQEQLDKLKTAKHACLDCGKRNGEYSARDPQFFLAECPLCGKQTKVTSAEHFGFFYRGLCRLRIHKARMERNARAQSKSA
jgi:hypothetical protein